MWWVVVVSLPEILRAYLSVVVVIKKKLSFYNSDPGDSRSFDPIPSPLPPTTVRSMDMEVVDSLFKK